MWYREDIQDISVTLKKQGNDYAYLEIRHKNNLILDTVLVIVFSYYTTIQYTKPYCEKYLGLVVEWIVNNRHHMVKDYHGNVIKHDSATRIHTELRANSR